MDLHFPDHAHCGALTGLLRSTASMVPELPMRTVAAGEHIYHQGDPTEDLYVVVSGCVRTSTVSPEGRRYILGQHGGGEAFGEVCFCQIRARQEEAVAIEDARVLVVSPGHLVRFASSGEQAALELLEMFSHRLADMEERLAELAVASVRVRVIGFLLRSAVGEPDAEGLHRLAERLTHEDIAERISTTREQVSAVLSELRRHGAISYDRRSELRVNRARLGHEL